MTPDLSTLSDTDLRANLCTLDWRGREFKEAALDELLRRAVQAHIDDQDPPRDRD